MVGKYVYTLKRYGSLHIDLHGLQIFGQGDRIQLTKYADQISIGRASHSVQPFTVVRLCASDLTITDIIPCAILQFVVHFNFKNRPLNSYASNHALNHMHCLPHILLHTIVDLLH